MLREKAALRQAIETLQQLELVRRRIEKLEKHLMLGLVHVRMIQRELGFEQKAR
jgi:hypothetical protein